MKDFWAIVLVIIACIISYYVGYQTGLNRNVDYLIYKDAKEMYSDPTIP